MTIFLLCCLGVTAVYLIVLSRIYYKLLHHYRTLLQDIEIEKSKTQQLKSEYETKMQVWKLENESLIRKDALERSRFIQRGQITEHLAPLILDTLDKKDMRFVGDPIDYLVCEGATVVTQTGDGSVTQVTLLDIKTGGSQLSKVQRKIRDAVIAGRVRFATYNPDTKEWREWLCKAQDSSKSS